MEKKDKKLANNVIEASETQTSQPNIFDQNEHNKRKCRWNFLKLKKTFREIIPLMPTSSQITCQLSTYFMWKVVKNPWLKCKNNCLSLHNFLTYYVYCTNTSTIVFSLFFQERVYTQRNFGQEIKGASLPDTRFSASGFFTNQFSQCP